MEGEARIRVAPATTVFALGVVSSNIPNSFKVGDGFAEDEAWAFELCRRLVKVVVPFNVGEPAAEVRLDMRGIFVGVSLDRLEPEFIRLLGGPLEVWEVLPVPTEGDPAIVGS